jgi:hypothetical protein
MMSYVLELSSRQPRSSWSFEQGQWFYLRLRHRHVNLVRRLLSPVTLLDIACRYNIVLYKTLFCEFRFSHLSKVTVSHTSRKFFFALRKYIDLIR